MDDAPLIARMTQACAGFDRVGVAVSGGSDSTAALVLAVRALGPARIAAVTVDHGLRPQSRAEAESVARDCARLGVSHDILTWTDRPAGNLQASARQGRRRLIADWAQGRVGAVILGHTQDDQAETVLLNIARGSGVDGLAAMPRRLERDGIIWLRPLLDTPRAALRDMLRARGIDWVDDPSNDNPAFDRVRMRQAGPLLAELGLSTQTLAALADRMQMARAVLHADAMRLFHAHVHEDRGTALVDLAVFEAEPESVERLFAGLITALAGAVYKPRLTALRRILDARGGTLGGVAMVTQGTRLRLFREYAAVRDLSGPATAPWDTRWTATGGTQAATLAPLGERGVTQLSQQAAAGLHPHWRTTGLPRKALLAQPGLWYEGGLIAAPLAEWPQGWRLIARPLAAYPGWWTESH